jgi:hypothetical protein
MTTRPTAVSAFTAFARMFKAIPADKMADVTDVLDQWNEPGGEHANPGRGEIVTGPAEQMSGAGAVKMTGEYSTPSSQQGLSEQYAQFSAMLDRHEATLKALLGFFGGVMKGVEKTAPNADSFLAKANQKLAKARTEIRRAELADEPDEKEQEERKSHLEAAAEVLNSAKRLLRTAKEEMEDTGEDDDDEIEKSCTLHKVLTKRLIKETLGDNAAGAEVKSQPNLDRLDPAKKARVEAEMQALRDIGIEQSSIIDFVSAAAGRGLAMPPDMSARAIIKSNTVSNVSRNCWIVAVSTITNS